MPAEPDLPPESCRGGRCREKLSGSLGPRGRLSPPCPAGSCRLRPCSCRASAGGGGTEASCRAGEGGRLCPPVPAYTSRAARPQAATVRHLPGGPQTVPVHRRGCPGAFSPHGAKHPPSVTIPRKPPGLLAASANQRTGLGRCFCVPKTASPTGQPPPETGSPRPYRCPEVLPGTGGLPPEGSAGCPAAPGLALCAQRRLRG